MSGWSRKFSGALVCAGLALAFGGLPERTAAADSGILRLSQRNEPADLDPATATLPDEFFIIRALAEGLVVPATDGGAPQPAAAETWEISPDRLTYAFRLRDGARWSNGEPVTADDFVASYRRVLNPATAAPKADLFFAVKNARAYTAGQITDFSAVGFRAEDARTLVVTLERPTPNFLLYAASGPWIPVNPRVVEKFGRTWTRPENHVGNGAFSLVDWRPHQHIAVKKNPAFPAGAGAKVGEIRFVALDNGDAEERAYRAGQIDVTMSVPVSKLDTYARERPDELHRAPLAETHYLTFNTQRAPLNDVRVRRALALSIDRARIVERVLRGGQQPAGWLVPPSLRQNPREKDLSPGLALRFDPAEARRLLAEAGFAGGQKFPRLELTSWARPAVLEAVQAMWKQELGIEVGIVMREAKVHVDSLRTGGYAIGFITQIPDVADPAAVLGDFTTAAPGNYPHWSDPAFDSQLNEFVAATDPSRRAILLTALERRLIAACPATPLYFNAKNWLMSPRVQGWEEDALWTRNYRNVSLGEK
ncbi:MAG TPA: peptide ABC transporter substrate-binding protein [Opitutaceae bacterium]|nr:peptide ABC transporter substrate-binding protein [Opitutaceae bacterium]